MLCAEPSLLPSTLRTLGVGKYLYYPLTQMRKPRLQVITCPKSHAQKKQSWDPLPRLHSKAHSLTPIHLAYPIPGAGARGKANNVLALGSRGPHGHRRTGSIWPGCGKEPRQVPAGSSLPAHQPHRRVSAPGWSWLPLSWTLQITQGWDPKGCRVQQKGSQQTPLFP